MLGFWLAKIEVLQKAMELSSLEHDDSSHTCNNSNNAWNYCSEKCDLNFRSNHDHEKWFVRKLIL